MNNFQPNPWALVAKFGFLGFIWLGVLLMGIFIAANSAEAQSSIVGLGIAGFIAAAVATAFVLAHDSDQQEKAGSGKAKNDSRAVDPMSLLTDDDIADLRAEMKDHLRRRMLEDSEETSFEALLSNASGQRKRR